MPPEAASAGGNDCNGLIGVADQPVSGQRNVITLPAGGVETPVFGDAEGGVVIPLPSVVVERGGNRGHFQREVRRLALYLNCVTHLGHNRCRIDVEGHNQVRHPGISAGTWVNRDFAHHQGAFRAAEMPAQGCHIASDMKVENVLHIVPGRKFREHLKFPV